MYSIQVNINTFLKLIFIIQIPKMTPYQIYTTHIIHAKTNLLFKYRYFLLL